MSVRKGWMTVRQGLGLVAPAMIGAGSLLAAAPAAALTPLEFENWKTDFSPNPIVCNGPGCQTSTTQTGIRPTLSVNRLATLDESATSVDAPALDDMVAATNIGCLATGGDGCLSFATRDGVFGSLSLDYQFASAQNLTNVGIQIANPGANAFNVDAFFYNGTDFTFADQYTIAGGTTATTFRFDFPSGATSSDVLIVYNPLQPTGLSFSQAAGGPVAYTIPEVLFTGPAEGIHAELCCVMANVPEPSAWALMLAGFLVAGAGARAARQTRREAA